MGDARTSCFEVTFALVEEDTEARGLFLVDDEHMATIEEDAVEAGGMTVGETMGAAAGVAAGPFAAAEDVTEVVFALQQGASFAAVADSERGDVCGGGAADALCWWLAESIVVEIGKRRDETKKCDCQ
mmetsp:Transcript_4008/g.8733  ORF Transcript_4008/g.8733 Transcript_4008/m.8733 type:complete len:128 (+) Transcript_4008:650-1033(+)